MIFFKFEGQCNNIEYLYKNHYNMAIKMTLYL